MDIKTKLKETKNRNNVQVKPQGRTDCQWSEADIYLCNKSQKLVPTPERRNLDEKITEFLEFSRKVRLAVYFDKRGKGKETSYEGEECWEMDCDGEGLWKPKSCFTPVEGDNEASEEFIDELFKYLFDPKNFRQVWDNLTPQERRSL